MSNINEQIEIEELEDQYAKIPEEVKRETVQGHALIDSIEDVEVEKLANALNDELNGECDNSKQNSTVMISATSKVSAELNSVWYSFSFTESRHIQDDSNMEEERQKLWDVVNVEVDNQVQAVIEMLKHPN